FLTVMSPAAFASPLMIGVGPVMTCTARARVTPAITETAPWLRGRSAPGRYGCTGDSRRVWVGSPTVDSGPGARLHTRDGAAADWPTPLRGSRVSTNGAPLPCGTRRGVPYCRAPLRDCATRRDRHRGRRV